MKRFLIVALALSAAAYGLYKLNYPAYAWHQKLTLAVDTPDGVRTGASVTEVEVILTPTGWPTATQLKVNRRGEAVVVDLGGSRFLFALLRGSGEGFARRVFRDQLADAPADRAGGRTYGTKARALSKLRATAPVPFDALPMLVTFGDIDDPTTVAPVDPDNLAASLGAGFALRDVTLEITDAPVTEGVVEGVLGWLDKLDGGMLDGRRNSTISAENPLANDLSRGSFARDGSF